ncbi:MAG: hypothetical protein KDI90_01520 [Alphaproteobacteria bacterium]|nr:hypothetical protein [Alphaproteobacteria bacterium]MCB9975271.1 hypothetical protein [Rhodospirillales bacterium]
MFKRFHTFCLAVSTGFLLFAGAGSVFAADGQAVPDENGKFSTCPICQKCGDAVAGEVPTVEGYCDIYARQLEYMMASRKFRASLIARQESYEAPRREALELYRKNLEAIYKADSKAYQEQLAREAEEAAKQGAMMAGEAVDKADGEEPVAPEAAGEKVEKTAATEQAEAQGEAEVEAAPAAEGEEQEPAVKEKVIEPGEEEEEPVKKRIIMPDDAPEFDESPF